MKSTILATVSTLLFAFSGNTSAESWTNFTTDNSPLPALHITAICHTENGTWIGTDDGLTFYDGTDWTVYKNENSDLPHNRVYDIKQDSSGKIWVATEDGLLSITKNGWNIFNTSNSNIPLNRIRSITFDADQNPWIGTWGGGVASLINGQWTTYNTNNSGISSNGVFAIEIDDFNHVWIGTFNGGVSIFNGADWVNYNTTNSQLPHDNVRSITFDTDGIVWMGTDAGLARKTALGNWNIYTFSNIGFTFYTVHDGVMESPGKLHFATDGGILQFDQNNFSFITFQNSDLSSNNTRCISIDNNSDLWIGTGYAGLNIYATQNTVGIKESSTNNASLSLFPNPATQEITLIMEDQKLGGLVEIQVINMLGQTVLHKTVANLNRQQYSLDISRLPLGTFQLLVKSKVGISTQKFVRM